MRVNGITITAFGAMLAGAVGWIQSGEMQHQDTRQAIRLPAMQRDMLLTEMRGLLTSVNGILRGVAARDTALMRASAANGGMAGMMRGEGMGMGMGMGGGRGMHAGSGRGMGAGRGMGPMMPAEFRSQFHSTRLAFDSLASSISAGVGADTVVARLARITDNCLACHATYRLEILPP
jgi:cytochrome c556